MLEHEILLNLLTQVNLLQSETNHAWSRQITQAHCFNMETNFTVKSTLIWLNSSSCASAMMDVDISLSSPHTLHLDFFSCQWSMQQTLHAEMQQKLQAEVSVTVDLSKELVCQFWGQFSR